MGPEDVNAKKPIDELLVQETLRDLRAADQEEVCFTIGDIGYTTRKMIEEIETGSEVGLGYVFLMNVPLNSKGFEVKRGKEAVEKGWREIDRVKLAVLIERLKTSPTDKVWGELPDGTKLTSVLIISEIEAETEDGLMVAETLIRHLKHLK